MDSFWIRDLRVTMEALHASGKEIRLDALIPLVRSGEAVTLEGFDEVSQSKKTLRRTNVHVAGVSCKPWAPNGPHTGAGSHEMTATAAWAAIIFKLKPDVVIVEESSLFPGSILEQLFGDLFLWQTVLLCGTSFGHPVRRKRFYGIGHNKLTVGKVTQGHRLQTLEDLEETCKTLFAFESFELFSSARTSQPQTGRRPCIGAAEDFMKDTFESLWAAGAYGRNEWQ